MKRRKTGKGDDLFGFMKGKAKIIGDTEHSVPLEDWNLSHDDKNKSPKQYPHSSRERKRQEHE